MEFEAVKVWFEKHNDKQIRRRRTSAIIGFVLLPFAAALSVFVTAVFVLVFTRDRSEPVTNEIVAHGVVIALGIVGVIFLVSLLTSLFASRKTEPEKYYHEGSDDDGSFIGHYRSRFVARWKFILWFIMTGPRLLDWSITCLRDASQLKKKDTHSCAGLLWLLMNSRNRVSYDLIPQQLDWLDLDATLPQLMDLPGVVLLKSSPPGLSLTDDLRTAIRTGKSVEDMS